jgi:hypothetical protein
VKSIEYEVLLDYDMEEEEFMRDVPMRLQVVFGTLKFVNPKRVRVYQTKNGFHVYLNIYSKLVLLPNDLCCLQALFGSDFKRECFNLVRIKTGMAYWNVLFSKKWEVADGEQVILSKETHRPDLEPLVLNKIIEIRKG